MNKKEWKKAADKIEKILDADSCLVSKFRWSYHSRGHGSIVNKKIWHGYTNIPKGFRLLEVRVNNDVIHVTICEDKGDIR